MRARGEARRAELAAAARVLEALAAPGGRGGGEASASGGDGPRPPPPPPPLRGLSLEGGEVPLDFFVGAVLRGASPAVVGHSFGAALAADAAAGGGAGGKALFSAAVCLDPW